MITNKNMFRVSGVKILLRVGVTTALALGASACASRDEVAAEPAPGTAAEAAAAPAPAASSTPLFGGAPSPRFIVPSAANESMPDINSVPTQAPTPKSTAAERAEARRGLIADQSNVSHSDQGGRVLPVTVRPYVASAAPAEVPEAPAALPEETAERLDAPAPARPAEATGPTMGPAPAAKIPAGN
jgi:hypothetical protein